MLQNNFQPEPISNTNIIPLTRLSLELWPDCVFEEELANFERILSSENETCYLVKTHEEYIAFVQLSLRFDYVEGSTSSPVAYIEGIYVKPVYRRQNIGEALIGMAELWAKQKNCSQLASDTAHGNDLSILFHRRAGFTEVSKIVCFIKTL